MTMKKFIDPFTREEIKRTQISNPIRTVWVKTEYAVGGPFRMSLDVSQYPRISRNSKLLVILVVWFAESEYPYIELNSSFLLLFDGYRYKGKIRSIMYRIRRFFAGIDKIDTGNTEKLSKLVNNYIYIMWKNETYIYT